MAHIAFISTEDADNLGEMIDEIYGAMNFDIDMISNCAFCHAEAKTATSSPDHKDNCSGAKLLAFLHDLKRQLGK